MATAAQRAAMVAQLRASAGNPPAGSAPLSGGSAVGGTNPPRRPRPPRPPAPPTSPSPPAPPVPPTPPVPPPPPAPAAPRRRGTLPTPPTPPASVAPPAASRRSRGNLPRAWLGFFLGLALAGLGMLLIANLAGFSPAVVRMEKVRVVAPPVSQFGDRPWERPAKPAKPAPAPKKDLAPPAPAPKPQLPAPVPAPAPCNCTRSEGGPTGPPINASYYAPAPAYQPQPVPHVTVLTPIFTYGGPPPGYYGQRLNLPPSRTALCYPGTPGCRLYVQPGGAEVWLPY